MPRKAAPTKAAKPAPKRDISPPPLTRTRGTKRAATTAAPADDDDDDDAAVPPSPKRAKPATTSKPSKPSKRTLASAKDQMPLAARTIPHALAIGAHVSAAGGVHKTVPNALHIGANAFACFLKSQRKWANPALNPEHADLFASACSTHAYAADQHVVPHGSYLVNLAAEDDAKGAQAYTSFLDDLQRCDTLGIRLYNFHPGNTNGAPRAAAIARLAARLNDAHKATTHVVTLLENMAAAPDANTIGGRFEDLRDVIALVADKARVGVCLDTCHAFAAGYDLRSPAAYAATMAEFDRVVGRGYLRALHLNDSKAVFRSHRDLHQNIGLGFLGLRAFHNVVNDAQLEGVPMVLETPIDRPDAAGKRVEDFGVWSREIKLLESLRGMDVEGEEFARLERELADEGAAERAKLQAQFDGKAAGGKAKAKAKGKRAADTEDENSD